MIESVAARPRAYHVRRLDPESLEVREASGGAPPSIRGYAAVFDSPTEIASGYASYNEVVAPGAFKKTLQEADVRALFNHDENFVLGRLKAGTLRLSEDEVGLRFDVSVPETTWARDLVESMRRGDVNQSSFAFQPIRQQWTKASAPGEIDTRTLQEVRLFDVSVVTYPAYPDTVASVRSSRAAALVALGRVERGQGLSEDDIAVLREVRAMLDGRLQEAIAGAPGASHATNGPALGHSIEMLRRRLRLIEAGA